MYLDEKLFHLVCKMITEEFVSEEHKLKEWKVSNVSPCARTDSHDKVMFGMMLQVSTKNHSGPVFVMYNEKKALFDIVLLDPGKKPSEIEATGIPLSRVMIVLSKLLE